MLCFIHIMGANVIYFQRIYLKLLEKTMENVIIGIEKGVMVE